MIEQDVTRKSVVFTWDADLVGEDKETVELRAINPEDPEEVHTRELVNDGVAAIWFPSDYSGIADLEVVGSKGSDTGQVSVGDASED